MKGFVIIDIRLIVVALPLLLAACGGGGGGAPPTPGGGVPSTPGGGVPSTPGIDQFGNPSAVFPPNTFATTTSPVETEEYSRSHGLAMVNANVAYTAGISGYGVVLGQIDSGAYWEGAGGAARMHSDLQGKIVTPSSSANARVGGRLPSASAAEHGTSVAGMMVARRDGSGVHGIAPGAMLRIFTLGLGRANPFYMPIRLGGFLDANVGLIRHFTQQGDVLAVNNSWGYPGLISEYGEAGIRAAMPNFLAALAQAGTAVANRKIFVWAAGNTGNSLIRDGSGALGFVDANVPDLLAGLPVHIAELRGHSLAVASVKVDGTISDFSNRCGAAAAFCLAAPGEVSGTIRRITPDTSNPDNVDGLVGSGGGTSFAAPLVTGALALLKERFNTMGNTALVTRLLATATKTGIYGDSSIYGQGLLNVDAALTMAIGPIAIRTGSSLGSSRSHSSADSGFELSGPLSSLRSAAAGYEIEGYDDIGTPFRLSLQNWLPDNGGNDALQRLLAARFLDGSLLSAQGDGSYTAAYRGVDAEGRHLSGSRLWHGTGGGSGWWFASGSGAERRFAEPLFAGVQGFASPFNGMAEGGFAFGVQGEVLGEVLGGKALWQLESYVPGYHHSTDSMRSLGVLASVGVARGSVPWRVTAGLLREGESVLGSRGRGAFAGADASTWHGGLELAHHSGDWSYYASGYVGVTSGSGSADIWQGVDSVYSSSWAIGLVRRSVFSSADAVGLRLVQSLRAESGDVRLRLPDSRDTLGNLYSKDVNLRLEPDGRELDLALSWQRAVYGGSFSMDVGITTQPNHVSGESSRAWAGLAWLHRF